MDDTVERLYLRLADALQRTRRNGFAAPVTVAEIYQELVPYRLVRGEVGFAMNADYEHALLRLLAGEGDRARLEPTHAREQITRELKSTNPNVSMYREYAGCDVWVTPPEPGQFDPAAKMRDVLADDDDAADAPTTEWESLVDTDDRAERDVTFALVDSEPADAKRAPERAAAPRNAEKSAPAPAPARTTDTRSDGGASSESRAQKTCGYCDTELPEHRPVRFCPYCGQDQTLRPCASCGEVLEPGWMFCVSCGTSRDAG